MVIDQLKIKDYKIFQGETTINFPDNNKPVIFVGINGAGKTTMLTAIIGCFWEYYRRVTKTKTIDGKFSRSDINIYADEFASVKLRWKNNGVEENLTQSGFKLSKTIDPFYQSIGKVKEVEDYISRLKGDIGYFKYTSLPILVYYPVERMVLTPSLKGTPYKDEDQFDSYYKSLEASINFDDFFEWFRKREDIENEVRLNQNQTFLDSKLDAVRKAILSFLKGFNRIRVKRLASVSLVLQKGKDEFEINQLSHGEKALISLVGDLARRLVIANPGSKDPLTGKGIVLIDELGLHLHPKWQRTILKKLRETFSGIQFICTTHSPLIINHLHTDSIFVLEQGACYPLKDKYSQFNSYGADIEDVLKIIQGTTEILPTDVVEKFNKLFRLIRTDKLEEAKELVNELENITDPNQPELKKAQSQIKYKEIIQK